MARRSRILLASRSPQRSLLLTRAGIAFQVVGSDGDEEAVQGLPPAELCLERARVKAQGARIPDDESDGEEMIALGADTVVALDGVVYGSPATDEEARATLTALQGTTHEVMTGHWCVRSLVGVDLAEAGEVARARVTMRAVSPAEIAAYVASGESRGRAGAYAIQEHGDRFVVRIEGEWDTIVGLHVAAVRRLVARVGGSSGTV
jgi:septum formation protein